MNNLSREMLNDDGSKDTLMMESSDNRQINLSGNYCLANRVERKQSKLAQKFKGSILGAEIGTKNSGFGTIAILAAVIAVGAIAIMYFLWRF